MLDDDEFWEVDDNYAQLNDVWKGTRHEIGSQNATI